MRTGQGTFVAQGPSKFLDRFCAHGLLNSRESVEDLTTARIALEGELAALCAQRASADQVSQLENLVARIKNCREEEEFLELDLQFHLAIASFSRNEILAQFLRAIRSLLQEVIRKSAQLPNDRKLTYEQHLKVCRAIRDKNGRKARAAMRSHLKTFQAGYNLLTASGEEASEGAR
jgi:GntR family transcriptional repressor for pyruvate dehydrogenase complex